MNRVLQICILNLAFFSQGIICYGQAGGESKTWPKITAESKPWTRWWWHGSGVTREGITHELEMLANAGFGGVEITPIYGVYGREETFVTYLSPEWVDLLEYTLKEARRLGLGVDMATGTGWPFGGPWISDDDACRNVKFKTYHVVEAKDVPGHIEYLQEPLLRRVGFNIPGTSHPGNENDISKLKHPVHANQHMQVLAIDQIRFEKRLPLVALMAYDSNGTSIDLTDNVAGNGVFNWKYPGGEWKLIAVFSGWHGKMVERAGPGGEGNVIDHFSAKALNRYLSHFDSAFQGTELQTLRAFFNDSYEVDDATGAADWTPDLLAEFKQRRGYDLRNHLKELVTDAPNETSRRVLCDYRETISELLLENFTLRWREWAHRQGARVRNQAHGSPANILDLYSAVDIPEIEGEEPLRIRMASSAGNVSGKNLIAAEAATWLNEHFTSNLADVKMTLDRFMLNGVNHLVYHGTAYSPANEPWPGWLFYAAVHFNARNPFWRDLAALNQYVARCQSYLQGTTPDNDVLLYYPIYDRFSAPGPELIEHFDGIGKQFEGTSFGRCAEKMLREGYAFDFISDRQINDLEVSDGTLKTSGNSRYRVLAIPKCDFMPVATLQKIRDLANAGATVIFFEGLPESHSGFANMDAHAAAFREFTGSFDSSVFASQPHSIISGNGKMVIGTDLEQLLTVANVRRESFKKQGLDYIRKKRADETIYLIVNNVEKEFQDSLTFDRNAKSIEAYDPMTGQSGKLMVKSSENSGVSAYIHLDPKQSIILVLSPSPSEQSVYPMYSPSGKSISLDGPWTVEFIDGGPTMPKDIRLNQLTSWTTSGSDYANFSGTAKYRFRFVKPEDGAEAWRLDLGDVRESASVYLNGKHVGTCIGPQYSLIIPGAIIKKQNLLEVVVSNSMANRIAFMDRQGVTWKRFYNINFPARKPANERNGIFDASEWTPAESGLLGPVLFTPLKLAVK